jgi:LuxR family maltose regulon positive regulatory protein
LTTPLLTTKFYFPPVRQDLVRRPQLMNRLNANLWHEGGFLRKLTLVSASAGYGKTTLITDWLRSVESQVTWLSLDEDDNDPARFFIYLIAALQQIAADIGGSAQALLQSPQPPPAETLLTALINEIASLPDPFILVLDDFHCIHTPSIHEQLAFLLEHQPPQMHLVILTREDPSLPLHRFRARGLVLEIRQDDLRFSSEEADYFLQKVIGLNLSSDQVAALTRRTEGWVAGLQLAGLSLRGRTDAQNFVQSFTGSNRFILDYLFEEIFQRQTPTVQAFLLSTSILTRFCTSLCDAVFVQGIERESRDHADDYSSYPLSPTPYPFSTRSILEYLERANLFIFPLDQEHTWYRFHRLFAELLRHQLRLHGEPPEALLHQRASRWYWEHGFSAQAVQHSLAAADWEQAAEQISASTDSMLKRGEYITLINWYAQLPAETISAQPRIGLNYSWSLMLASQFEHAELILRRLEQSAQGERALMGEVATAQAFLAQSLGDSRGMVELSHKALALLAEDNVNSRGIVALNLGIAYWHIGRLGESQQALEQALPANRQSGNTYGEMMARLFLGRVWAVRGHLRQALTWFEEVALQAEKNLIFPLVHLDLFTLHYEWNNLESAARHLAKGLESSQQSGNLEFQIGAHMLQARLKLAQRDLVGAEQALEQARHLEQTSAIPSRTLGRIADLQAQLALRRGDLETALQLAPQLEPDADCHPFYRFLGLTRSRLSLAQGRKAEAAEQLAAAAQIAQRNDWGYALVATRVLQALAAETIDESLEFLGAALRIGEPEGFIGTFVEAGEPLIPRLQEAARRGMQPEYVGQILSAIQGRRLAVPTRTDLVEPLSERELEVLRLVAAGLSNREIAGKLILSLGTIKTHIHNIYGKLDVRNRAQAVDRARELELL